MPAPKLRSALLTAGVLALAAAGFATSSPAAHAAGVSSASLAGV